jgi:hypothetical protein
MLNGRFQLDKRSQLVVSLHNESLSVAAMCVSKPYYSPFTIQS